MFGLSDVSEKSGEVLYGIRLEDIKKNTSLIVRTPRKEHYEIWEEELKKAGCGLVNTSLEPIIIGVL